MSLSLLDRSSPAAGGRAWATALLTLAVAASLTALIPRAAQADWPWSGWFGEEAPVGTPEWWKENKDEAIFELGQGYKVEGVDGYFDQDGRPLGRPVTVAQAVAQAPHPDELAPDEIGLIPGLDPQATYGKVKSAVGLGPSDQVSQQKLTEAEQLFQAQKYSTAAERYEAAADRAINMRLKEDALFMAAESHYFADRYIKARDAYNALADKYPSTRYLDRLVERQWKIAQYWENYEEYRPDWAMTPNGWDKTRPGFDTLGHAIKTYDNIRMNDPTGPRADDAIMATAGIYFRRNRYDDADYQYSLLRREYPRSEFQFEAHLLGLQSKMRKYQGPDYDGTPLEEAEKLIVQLRRNFAGQLSADERERLKTTSADLNRMVATRDMRMAQYYDGTKYYGAARGYYAEVINKYPDSELAQQARDRLAELGGEPDEPPKRLAWFVDIFPESAERRAVANVPVVESETRLAEQPPSESPPPAVPATTTR